MKKVFLLVVCLIVMGAGCLTSQQADESVVDELVAGEPGQEQVEERGSIDVFESGMLFLVRGDRTGMNTFDYSLVVLDPETKEEYVLDTNGVDIPGLVNYDAEDEIIYYFAAEEDSAEFSFHGYNLSSKTDQLLSDSLFEVNEDDYAVNDFLMRDSVAYYLHGGCSEVYPCWLDGVDFETGEDFELDQVLTYGRVSGMGLSRVEGENGEIYLASVGGDGPAGFMTVYTFDIEGEELNEEGFYRTDSSCTEENVESSDYCMQETLDANQAFSDMLDFLFASSAIDCEYGTTNGDMITFTDGSTHDLTGHLLTCK